MIIMWMKKLLFLLSLILVLSVATTEAKALAGCPEKCGDVEIPYPFGVGIQPSTSQNCFLDQPFNLTCENSTSTLYFKNYTVSNIFLQQSKMEISMPVSQACSNHTGQDLYLYTKDFTVSSTQNKFLTVGCSALGVIGFNTNFSYYSGCVALCDKPPPKEFNDKTCSGTGCCQVDIPKGMNNIYFQAFNLTNFANISAFNNCTAALIAKNDWFNFSPAYLSQFPFDKTPLVLDWTVPNDTCQAASNKADYACKSNTDCVDSIDGSVGYNCKCKSGFEGNPYHPDGCQGIDGTVLSQGLMAPYIKRF